MKQIFAVLGCLLLGGLEYMERAQNLRFYHVQGRHLGFVFDVHEKSPPYLWFMAKVFAQEIHGQTICLRNT